MNDKPTHREEWEERVTAYLLGELEHDQSAEVERMLQEDAGLAAFGQRMRKTLGLVRTAMSAATGEEEAPVNAPAQLSKSRRRALLKRFKKPAPRKKLARPIEFARFRWVIPVSLAASLIVFLGVEAVMRMGREGGYIASVRVPRVKSLMDVSGVGRDEGRKTVLAKNDRWFFRSSAELGASPADNEALSERIVEFDVGVNDLDFSVAPPPPASVPPPSVTPNFAAEPSSGPSRFARGRSESERSRVSEGYALLGDEFAKGVTTAPEQQSGSRERFGGAQDPVSPLGAKSESATVDNLSTYDVEEMVANPIAGATRLYDSKSSAGKPMAEDPDVAYGAYQTIPDNLSLAIVPEQASRESAVALGENQNSSLFSMNGGGEFPGPASAATTPSGGVGGSRGFAGGARRIEEVVENAPALAGEPAPVDHYFDGLDRRPAITTSIQEQPPVVENFARSQGLTREAKLPQVELQQERNLRLGRFDDLADTSLPTSPAPIAQEARRLNESQVMERNAKRITPSTGLPEQFGAQLELSEDESLGRLPKLRAGAVVEEFAPVKKEAKDALAVGESAGNQLGFELEAALGSSPVENEELKAKAPAPPPAEPLPEVTTALNAFSTFSLNVSDVSFKLAAASLANGQMPEPNRVRSEEFINAFDYRDPAPALGARIGFAWEQAHHAFAHNRDLVRFSVQTAAVGREPGQALNVVLLVDNSGSMERADRVRIIQEALTVLARQLTEHDLVSVVSFARTPRLWIDGMAGGQPEELVGRMGQLNPQGGTNLELAMDLAYEVAQKHFLAAGNNRVILLTDGAANLGNVAPTALKAKVETFRQKGIALDCFGVGWEGYNDDLLEVLSRNGDGRYGFLNDPVEAAVEFAGQLAGALQVAASDVKAQVEFNPERVLTWRQIGYEKHQLTKEQFRDNTVDAAEIGAAESGTALYSIQVNPGGTGPLGTVRVRFKVPSTGRYQEREWVLPYDPAVPPLDQAYDSMKLAAVGASFAEWLAGNPYAGNVTLSELQRLLAGVPERYALDPRPRQLDTMIQQAQRIAGQ